MDFSSTVLIDWHQVLLYHSLFVFKIYLTRKCSRLTTSVGLQKRVIEMVVLEDLKIQLHLNLAYQVFIVPLFSKDEKDVVITKLGMKQLIIHMYGQQPWIKVKINNMKIFSLNQI